MEDLSLTSLGFSVLSIVIIGILLYLYNKREKIKLDKIIKESNAATKESELIRKESKKLLEELEIEKQEREKEKLAKIKLDEFYQKEIDEIKKEKSKYDIKKDTLLPLDCNKEKERIAELEIAINSEKERIKSLESTLRHNLAAAAVFKDKAVKKEESSDIEKKELNSIIEELRLKLDKHETRRKPVKKRVSKYNNENTLYIAYDFNILNNESYLDIRKKIINLKDNTKLDAIRTTSVIFLNSIYLDIFTDIILVKKSGVSISLRTLLVDNPSYYIENKNLLKKPTFDTVLIFGGATGILQQIDNGNIKFKREK